MQGLVLQVPDLGLVFLAKCGANILFLCLIEFMVIIAYGIFFSVDIYQAVPALFILTAVLVPGFAAAGTLLSAISVCTNSREVVLPVLLYPLLLIPVAASALVTNDILELGYLSISSIPFLVVCVFSVVSFVISWLLFEFVVRG
jgi:heme exporter protein B